MPSGAEPLGARIRRLRRARGLTQRELAEPRYDRGFLAKVESGGRLPSDDVLSHLARRLGLTADELRFGRPAGAAEELTDALETAYRELQKGGLEAAEREFTRVERRAAEYRLPDVQCHARFYLGEVQWQRYDIPLADKGFAHAMELAGTASPRLRAMIVNRVAACRALSGDLGASVALVETALAALRAEEPVDPDAELALVTALIHPLIEMGALRRARRAAEEGHRALASARRKDISARYHRQAAQLWQEIGLVDRAEKDLSRALRLFTSLGYDRDAARSRWARGFLWRRLGKLDEAHAELQLARDLLAKAGSREGVLGATIELADVRRRQGELDEATELAEGIRPLLDRSPDIEARAEVLRLLGLIARARGDLPEATALLEEAATAQEKSELRGALVATSLHLGDTLRARGLIEEAAEAYRRGVRAAAMSDSGPTG
ncbi:XRE family transcriptional regulator [Amycolatopsis sp. WAC 01376]|uniref:helix-turn-helix domain-containing protein n=1 Tax=Amycolatopsis sp. WAC 01376 TaxID=2203195 RepID=UPI000F7A4905|nr:helix-turn-helix transcriptional regulator [Amycolatopsis sp. WAC 01376]RSM54327.1 XRE family transcriptional regulator [Amycolatopsis sp. WAC 01376]